MNTPNIDIGKITVTAAKAGGNIIASSYWKPFKIYKAKITLDDVDANGLQLIEYEFTIELRDVCSDDTLSKNALNDLYTYIYGTGATTITPVFAATVVAAQFCPTAATLEFWDPVTL